MEVAGLVAPRAGGVARRQRVHRRPAGGEVLDRGGDLADEQHLGALRRPHPQLRLGDAAAHRALHQLGEDLLHLRGVRDDVDAAQQGLRDPPHLRHLPVDADAAAVALEPAGDAGDGGAQLLGRLVVVLAVGQQDRVPLRERGHRVEQPAGQRQPGAHGRAAVGAELGDGLVRAVPGRRVHPDQAGAAADRRVGQVGLVAAGDDGEPGAVDDLVDGGGRGRLGGLQLGAAHRAGGVDDDDLARVTAAGLTGGPRAGAGQGDDRVDVRAAVGQELVLVDAGAELGHRVGSSSAGSRTAVRLVSLSMPVDAVGGAGAGPPAAGAPGLRSRP